MDYEKSMAREGYILISGYVNARTKLEYECPNGHKGTIYPYNWKRGTRCKECFNERQRQKNNKTSELEEFRKNYMDNIEKQREKIDKWEEEKELLKEQDQEEVVYTPRDYKQEFLNIVKAYKPKKGEVEGIENVQMSLEFNVKGKKVELWLINSHKGLAIEEFIKQGYILIDNTMDDWHTYAVQELNEKGVFALQEELV